MNRLITSVVVHYKNGEKQTLALIERENDYVIAPYFVSEEKGWNGSGEYLFKCHTNVIEALRLFTLRIQHESDSIFVKDITF